MTHRVIVSSLIALFFASVLYTTNGCGGTSTEPNLHFANITGVVTNAVSGAPVANATITFTQSGVPPLTAKTDNEGRYSAAALTPGNVRIDATATSYQPFSTTIALNEGSNTLNIVLHPN